MCPVAEPVVPLPAVDCLELLLGNGSGISTGRSSTPAPTSTPVAVPDPIAQSLRPAVSFIAEGVRQLKAMKLTAANRQAARQELQLLKAQITELEKVLD